MKNRSNRDNTIVGIAENIAELDALPGQITDKRKQIEKASAELKDLSAVEHEYSDVKIPLANRQMTALSARISMLELPASIAAIQELVKKDAATIADAESVKATNEKDVQPHRDEHKKIKYAIDLHASLTHDKSFLSSDTNTLENKVAELASLKDKLTSLQQRRDIAYKTAAASRQQFDDHDNDLRALRAKHYAEEAPLIDTVNQLKNSLGTLKSRQQAALQHQREADNRFHDEEKAERRHTEKSQQAHRDEIKCLAQAEAAQANKRGLLADLGRQRSAYESAKQAAAYSSNAGSGGYGSSSNGAPPSTTGDTIAIPTGFGGSVQVAAPSSTFSSDQGGSNSNNTYSANVSNNGNVLAEMLQKIAGLERSIQNAEDEAKRFERKAASEHEDAHNHEAKAATAHQHAHNYAEQGGGYALQASSLQTEIVHVNADLERETSILNQNQQRMRNEDDRSRKIRDASQRQCNDDASIHDDLHTKHSNTSDSIDTTNKSIANLRRDIENTKQRIVQTEAAIKANDYATRFSRQQLEDMRDEQIRLAKPYLNKIEECDTTIRNTTSQKRSKEAEISKQEASLRAVTATVNQSNSEFGAICASEDIPNLQKQLSFAKSESEDLQQQLNAQRGRVRNKGAELTKLKDDLEHATWRERDLQSGNLLMRLYKDPASEVTSLHNDLLASITSYAKTHHSGLNWRTRASLLTLGTRANFIFNNDVDGKTEGDKLRNKFYQLSGLIQHEMEFVKNDLPYFTNLLNLLKGRMIEERDVLDKFNQLAGFYPQQLRDMSGPEVANYDISQYNIAKSTFDNLLKLGPQHNDGQWRSLYRAGRQISSCIHKEEVKARKLNEPEFDVHLHTRIFELASEVLQNPNNHAARKELHELTHDNKIGKPSTPRIVIGAILSFIGAAAALVGGLALACLIPGISLPIAAPMIAVGGAGVVSGLFTLFSGFERGLSKGYSKFEKISADIGSHMPPAPPREASATPSEYFEPPAPSAPSLNNF